MQKFIQFPHLVLVLALFGKSILSKSHAGHNNKYSTEVPAKLQHYSAESTLNILTNYKCIKCWQNSFSDKKLLGGKPTA